MPYPLGDRVEETKTTRQTKVATSITKAALKAMIREACHDEHISEETEEGVAEGLLGVVEDAVRAYSACRAYAWEGIGISYEVNARIDCSSISSATLRKTSNGLEMDLPPSPF